MQTFLDARRTGWWVSWCAVVCWAGLMGCERATVSQGGSAKEEAALKAGSDEGAKAASVGTKKGGAAVDEGAARALPDEGQPVRTATAEEVTLRFYANGHIAVTGKDRWQKNIETIYESAEYLRNALPVLERSLQPATVVALRAELGAAAAKDEGRVTPAEHGR